MCEDEDTTALDRIAQQVGEVNELPEDSDTDEDIAREGEDFDPEEYRRSMDDYDGGWDSG